MVCMRWRISELGSYDVSGRATRIPYPQPIDNSEMSVFVRSGPLRTKLGQNSGVGEGGAQFCIDTLPSGSVYAPFSHESRVNQ